MSTASDFFLKGGGTTGGHGQPLMPPSKISPSGSATSSYDYSMFSFSNGNTYVATPTDSDNLANTFQLRDQTGVVFGVSLNSINSALAITTKYWMGCYWYDNVDELFYILAVDDITANRVYLITITKTGTIALVGSDTTANWAAVPNKTGTLNQWKRAAQGSGNFTVSSLKNETVISSSTGLVVSTNSAFALVGGTGTVPINPSYISRDGKVAIGQGIQVNTSVSNRHGLPIVRKDAVGTINMEQTMPMIIGHTSTTGAWSKAKFIEWDGGILLVAVASSSSVNASPVYGVRQWEIAAFDEWLHSMCTYLGLAEE